MLKHLSSGALWKLRCRIVHAGVARSTFGSENGKKATARHGAHFKLEKARGEVVLTNEKELRILMQEVEKAKTGSPIVQ